MNKKRRKEISNVVANLEENLQIISDVKDCEESALENIPESLQGTEKAESISEFIDMLEMVYDSIQEAIDVLEEIINY